MSHVTVENDCPKIRDYVRDYSTTRVVDRTFDPLATLQYDKIKAREKGRFEEPINSELADKEMRNGFTRVLQYCILWE